MNAAGVESMLPVNIDAERTILGCVLMDGEAMIRIGDKLRPDHFSLDSHRRIFSHFVEMQQAGTAIDTVTLMESLMRSSEFVAVGGATYTSGLTNDFSAGMARTMNLEHYIKIVRDKALARAIIHACNRAIQATVGQEEESTQYLDDLEHELLSLREDVSDGKLKHGADLFQAMMGELDRKRASDGEIHGLPIGISSLDRVTGGIENGELWIIGGRPGSGKTALAVQATITNCKERKRVGVFSIEMKGSQFMRRIAAQVAKIPGWKLKFPKNLTDDDLELLRRTEEFIRKNWNLWIDESSGISTVQLVSRAIVAAKRHSLDLMIIDHLGKVRGKGKNIEERATDVVDGVTQFAKDYCPVIALSQLSRPSDHNLCEHPNMTELRGSGMIEANAHAIMLVHRGRDKCTKQLNNEDEIIIDKQREGDTGPEPVTFDKDLLMFKPREVTNG